MLCDAYMAANEALGLKRTPDYNCGDQEGTLLYQNMMKGGRRWSPVDAYLKPAMKRGNVSVITARWSSASTSRASAPPASPIARAARSKQIKARRDVILAAAPSTRRSSCRSPASAIPTTCAAIGVAVKHALPGVGRNFRDHYAIRVSALVKGAGSLNEKSRGLRLVGEVLRYAVSARAC